MPFSQTLNHLKFVTLAYKQNSQQKNPRFRYKLDYSMPKMSGFVHERPDAVCCKKKSDTDADNSNITDANIYLDLEETILWLKNNIEPTNEVTEKWKVTFSQRTNKKDTIEQYYGKFPCLSQPLGYLLLQNDFNQMYPERENSLFIKYPQMAVKIHKILQERKDSFIEEKLKIFQETDPEPTEGKHFCIEI
ncbi:hypothetical protein JTB14_003318 [Gonioctena quinquepunctata]|nr:hypothetical protein JTB14_003318 [Gonioctena quinquepunctata]